MSYYMRIDIDLPDITLLDEDLLSFILYRQNYNGLGCYDSCSSLAKRFRSSRQSVIRSINRFEGLGLIEGIGNTSQHYIKLTDKGLKLLEDSKLKPDRTVSTKAVPKKNTSDSSQPAEPEHTSTGRLKPRIKLD